MNNFDFSSYLSPFTWRYGSADMRHIFSQQHKYSLWRRIWVAVAEAEHTTGLVSQAELDDLKKQENNVDIERILEIEKETKHDVVAAIREFAEKAIVGGGKIHLGLTSMDVVDNAQALQSKEAFGLLQKKLVAVLQLLGEKIEKYADTPCLGYTHLQPAEPTTIGYRFAFYAQDLLMDYVALQNVLQSPLGKGIKGAVGTQASFASLLKSSSDGGRVKRSETSDSSEVDVDKRVLDLEQHIMESLGLKAVEISTQVSTRKIDYTVVSLLASIASSIAKFAADLRILQSPMIGEWVEPFGTSQVGSSAMPFKKNPINSEKICSLARMVAAMPQTMLENASHSYLERTLDDSANRRIVVPEAFLAVDEILNTAEKLFEGMVIHTERIARNLAMYTPFLASEAILMIAVKKGGDRQVIHERLRGLAMKAWEAVAQNKENPMRTLLEKDSELSKFITPEEIHQAFNVSSHVGTAPERARKIAEKIKKVES